MGPSSEVLESQCAFGRSDTRPHIGVCITDENVANGVSAVAPRASLMRMVDDETAKSVDPAPAAGFASEKISAPL